LGKIQEDALFFQPQKFFADHPIELIHGQAVAIQRRHQLLDFDH
jgi:hypothetical protein